MTRAVRWLGSLHIAVPLLITIAGVLAWGTIYEARFGTAAVQRVVYQSWWFQTILAFLALNLAVAALARYPWTRRHLAFVLAHIGIILILIGGIIGGRFGIEGQLLIPEGEAERTLQLPGNVLTVHLPAPRNAARDNLASARQAGQPNPGVHQVFPTNFEARAWVHEPKTRFPVALHGRAIELTVDRYYPDAVVDEEITDDGAEANPALHLRLAHELQEDAVWLFAKDPERFGTGWGEAHLLFFEPATEQQLHQLLGRATAGEHPRGMVSIRLPGEERAREIPVPERLGEPVQIEGSPYTVTFKDYFQDFAITEQGLTSRSEQPNNPAVSFTLSGPEGVDAHLVFAFHPEFPALHGREHAIAADIGYTHPAGSSLPPNSIGFFLTPSGTLAALLTGPQAGERQPIEPLEIGKRYAHPWLGYEFEAEAFSPRAKVTPRVTNRSDEVKAEFLHLVARAGEETAEGWVGLRGSVELALGEEPVTVEYRPAQRDLPVTIKLLDFRKIDYPGTQMAAGFESDVQLTDPQRGIILMRTISMNNPLRYRGFSFYQSSYVPGPVETTVLSVRSDPGTPLVYAGFLIVIAGVVSMFLGRRRDAAA